MKSEVAGSSPSMECLRQAVRIYFYKDKNFVSMILGTACLDLILTAELYKDKKLVSLILGTACIDLILTAELNVEYVTTSKN